VARSGQLQLVGPADQPPLLSLDAQGQPEGFAVLVASRVAALLSQAVGRPVQVRFTAMADAAQLAQGLGEGKAELACGLPFTWARDMTVDFTLPIGISGLRLLGPAGRFDGSPAGLAGRRIGVVNDSLAATELGGIQPAARAVPFASLAAAFAALRAGQLEGVIGDSTLLAGLVKTSGATNLALVPEEPYEIYAVSCVLPENDSIFRNLVNLAIARRMQAYLDDDPRTVAAVHRWVGPGGMRELTPEQIRGVYEMVLSTVEKLRPLPPGASPSTAPSSGAPSSGAP